MNRFDWGKKVKILRSISPGSTKPNLIFNANDALSKRRKSCNPKRENIIRPIRKYILTWTIERVPWYSRKAASVA
jgi:hypothetical protein